MDIKNLSLMQHGEADMGKIAKRFSDMEGKGKSFNVHLSRGPEGEEKMNRGDAIFEERMARKLLELLRNINFQIQKVQ